MGIGSGEKLYGKVCAEKVEGRQGWMVALFVLWRNIFFGEYDEKEKQILWGMWAKDFVGRGCRVTEEIVKGIVVLVLALILFIAYCCLIHNAIQDEVSEKEWEEFEKSENENWEE